MAFNRKQKLRDNIEAIRTAFILDREQRTPTARERLLLERYCGFGGLKCILNPAKELTDAVHWAKSDLELFAPTVELHKLVRENSKDETEYKRYVDAMKQSVLTAFYTPPEITGTIADVLHEHGIRPDRVLEPSAGVGAFVDAVLDNKPDADIMAFEKDLMTGKILKHLHPDQKVRVQGFEKIEKPFTDYFDLAISNIPFGDVAVFDPEFTGSQDPARRSASKTIHNYFFLKSLDAVREGGIVAFITSQGVLDAPSNAPIREYMMGHANLVGVARLPNNLFTDNAGTEVGSDLVILQKNSGKKRELYDYEKLFVQTEKTPIGSFENGYVGSIGMIPHSDLIRDTDPYGKPAYKVMHRGGIAQLAEDLREHLKIELHQLDRELYERHSLHSEQGKSTETEIISSSVVTPEIQPRHEMAAKPEAAAPQPIDEKPEIEPRRPDYSEGVQLSLLDLWGMTEEVRKEQPPKKKKAAKKGSTARRVPSKPQVAPKITTAPPQPSATPLTENGEKHESKPENVEAKGDPDDIYATLDWETNPPINGFYEMMMDLTPERRKELRELAAQHQEKRQNVPDVKAAPEQETRQPETQQKAQSRRLSDHADSLAARNAELNHQLQTLIKQMDKKVQTDLLRREAEITFMRERSFMQIGGLTGFILLLLIMSYIIIHRYARRISRYRRETTSLIAQLSESNSMNGKLTATRQKTMYTITHELRTPLTAIHGYAELIRKSGTAEIQHHAGSVLQASKRMIAMLNSLLSFFRLENGKERMNISPFRLQSIADVLEAEFRPMAESKDLKLIVENSTDVILMGDKERIMQIGDNLLSNAIKYTQAGSVSFHSGYDGKTLALIVEDTGSGMSEEEQQRVFGEFERLSNAATQDGFGLGLSIVKRIVDMMHGKIRLESEKGRGSRFTVEVPMNTADGISDEEKYKPERRFERSFSVIVLDDNDILLSMVRDMYAHCGIRCDACDNTGDLMEAVRTRNYDLLITDLKMPETNGYEVLELLRSSDIGNSKTIPVIVATASGSCTEEELLAHGFTACLFKPFDMAELIDVSEKCLLQKTDVEEYPDLSSLLAYGNKTAMLDRLITETEKDMQAMREAFGRLDRKALDEQVHRLRSSWAVIRADGPLWKLHELLHRDEKCSDEELRHSVNGVLRMGTAIIELARKEKKEEVR